MSSRNPVAAPGPDSQSQSGTSDRQPPVSGAPGPPAGEPRVAVFHPGTLHSHDTALALQRAGMLAWFATGVYYRPGRWPYSWLRWLPRRLRDRAARELGKRRCDELRDDLVLTRGAWEWAVLAAQRLVPASGLDRGLIRQRNRRFGRWAARLALRHRVDILHGYEGSSLTALQATAGTGVVRVLDVVGPDPQFRIDVLERELAEHAEFGGHHLLTEIEATRRAAPIIRDEIELADHILAGCSFAASRLEAAGVDPANMSVIPYCAAAPFTEYVERPPRKQVTLLHAGTITVRKGILYLLEAVKRLASPDLKLVMVGRICVSERGLARYEGLFTHLPHVPRSELWDIYASADIFTLPSLNEGFGRTLIEAAACGLPLICSTATGGPEIVGDDEGGFVVPPRDIDALAEKIDTLARSRDLRLQMGRRAWERAQQFDLANYSDQLRQTMVKLHGARAGLTG